jgi:hypothetical protein
MFSFSDLRIRIVVLFLIMVSFAVLITGFSTYRVSHDLLLAQLENTLDKSSETLHSTISRQFSDAFAAIEYLKNKDFTDSPEKNGYLSQNFIAYSNFFYNIFITDRDGKVVNAFYSDGRSADSYQGENLFLNRESPFVQTAQEVLKDGKTRFSPVFYARPDLPMMTCVSTIGTEGETKGLISAAIPINSVSLRYSLDQMKPPMDGLALLIAEDGTVFAADNATTEKKGSYSNSKIDLELLEKDYLLRSTKLNSGQITVVVAIEKNKFYQPLKKLNSSLFICIILSLTLASVAGLWLTNGIARPIAKLVEGLKAAGDGIYSTRIQCPADPEIGESLKAFNGLMEKLQKRRLIEKLWNESWDV